MSRILAMQGKPVKTIEIGSGVGGCAVMLASLGHQFQVLSFEPLSLHINLMCKTIEANNLGSKVTVIPCAADETRRHANLSVLTLVTSPTVCW